MAYRDSKVYFLSPPDPPRKPNQQPKPETLTAGPNADPKLNLVVVSKEWTPLVARIYSPAI